MRACVRTSCVRARVYIGARAASGARTSTRTPIRRLLSGRGLLSSGRAGTCDSRTRLSSRRLSAIASRGSLSPFASPLSNVYCQSTCQIGGSAGRDGAADRAADRAVVTRSTLTRPCRRRPRPCMTDSCSAARPRTFARAPPRNSDSRSRNPRTPPF